MTLRPLDARQDASPHNDCAEYRAHQRRRLWQQPIARASMLKGMLGVAAAGAAAPHLLLRSNVLDRLSATRGAAATNNILVVVQQGGGNDGLNMLVPYNNSLYYARRPTLAVPASSVLPLDGDVGLHPSMSGLHALWRSGRLAAVQGVGYPNPDLSHFQSTAIWQTAQTSGLISDGWLGRYLSTALAGDPNPLKAVVIGSDIPLALRSNTSTAVTMQSLGDLNPQIDGGDDERARVADALAAMNGGTEQKPLYAGIRAAGAVAAGAAGLLETVPTGYTSAVPYPQTDLAQQLQLVAQLVNADLGTRIFWVHQDGYDDHKSEAEAHPGLMAELDGAISAFYGDLTARKQDGRVLLMTWSEFGRRVGENADLGTDHGTAAPMLLVGGGVNAGVYGHDPVHDRLDDDGNLVFNVDFRSVYSTIAARWLNADPHPIVNGAFEQLPFLS